MQKGRLHNKLALYAGNSDFAVLKDILSVFERVWTSERGFDPPVGTQPPRMRPVAVSGAGPPNASASSTACKRHRVSVTFEDLLHSETDIVVMSTAGAFLGYAEAWTGPLLDDAHEGAAKGTTVFIAGPIPTNRMSRPPFGHSLMYMMLCVCRF